MTIVPLYVNPSTGSDSNNGTSPSTPFLTIQAAINAAYTQNLGGNPGGGGVPINLSAGTWTVGGVGNGPVPGEGSGQNNANVHMTLVGAGYTSSLIADASGAAAALIASNGARIGIQGVGFSSSLGSLLFPQYGAQIVLTGVVGFGTAAAGQLHAETHGSIFVTGTAGYVINGSAPSHFEAVLDGEIILAEATKTITLSGSPVFVDGFAHISSKATLYCPSAFVSFSGAAGSPTKRYVVETNAVIETNAGSATYFPGTIAGYMVTGGRYNPTPQPSIGSITGLGSGATYDFVSGSSDRSGVVQITTGTSPSATGLIEFVMGSGAADFPNGLACQFDLQSGTATLEQNATWAVNSTTGPDVNVQLYNAGTVFPAGNFYLHYQFEPF